MENKIYYKVVNKDMSSAYTGWLYQDNPLKVCYRENEWIAPNINGSKLMVFDTFSRAEYFMFNFGFYIYECEVKNPSKKGIFVSTGNDMGYRLLEVLKLKNRKKKFSDFLRNPPEGTVFCDAVKLTKCIKQL